MVAQSDVVPDEGKSVSEDGMSPAESGVDANERIFLLRSMPELISIGGLGTVGGYLVEMARPLKPGTWSLRVGFSSSRALDLIGPGDIVAEEEQNISLVWSLPWVEGLEVLVAAGAFTSNNNLVAPLTNQVLGDPRFALKYSHDVSEKISLGGLVEVLFPTNIEGSGLRPDAFSARLLLLLSYVPADWLMLSMNAGYKIERRDELFGTATATTLSDYQHYAFGLGGGDQILLGLGGITEFSLWDRVGFRPFLEWGWVLGVDLVDIMESPMFLEIGSKFFSTDVPYLEFLVSMNVRLTGTPAPGGGYAAQGGIAPWEFHGAFAVLWPQENLKEDVEPRSVVSTCSENAECRDGYSCHGGECAVVKEVVKEVVKTEIQEVIKPPPTWQIKGVVSDQTSKEPISDARISLSGEDSSDLIVDPETGVFQTYPLQSSDGLIQIRVDAPGYRRFEKTMPRQGGQTVLELTIEMLRINEEMLGVLRGVLKDAQSGLPVKGKIFVPTKKTPTASGADGKFSMSLKGGAVEVLLSAPGYVTQRKKIEIRPGDVIILNVDLRRKEP